MNVDKAVKNARFVQQGIKKAIESRSVSLLEMQKLMGRLNDVAQLCPFMRLFKHPLNNCLAWLQNNDGMKMCLTSQAKKDLWVWAGMISDSSALPIPLSYPDPPLRHMHFISDAAGVPENETNMGTGVGGWEWMKKE